jgi:uncharacterized membrane protein
MRALEVLRATALSFPGVAFASALCLVAADVRNMAEIDPGYGFFRWNLFLAWITVVLAYGISWAAKRELSWPLLPVLGVAWIIFLPNAPYLVTDLVHLDEGFNKPNLIVLSLLAIAGVLTGVKAVQLVLEVIERFFGLVVARWSLHAIAVLTAFGIYLGRVKRWNSWTIVEEPNAFLHAAMAVPSNPDRALLAAAGTVAFAVAFSIVYRALAGPSSKRVRTAPAEGRPGV